MTPRFFLKMAIRICQVLTCWLIGLGMLSATSHGSEKLSPSLPRSQKIAFYFTQIEKNLPKDLAQAQASFNEVEPLVASARSKKYWGQYFRLAGQLAVRKKAYARGTKYYFLALEYLQKTSNTEDQVKTYLELGDIYLQLFNPQKALKYYQSGLKLLRTKDRYFKPLSIKLNLQIAQSYAAMQSYDRVFIFLDRAMKLAQFPPLAATQSKILLAYGINYAKKKKYNQAFTYLDSAWTLAQQHDLIPIKITILEQQSQLTLACNQPLDALKFASLEKKVALQNRQMDAIIKSDYLIAKSFLAQEQLDSALQHNTQALESAKTLHHDTLLHAILKLQSTILQHQGKLPAALYAFDQLTALDSQKISNGLTEKSQRLWEEMTIMRTEDEVQKRLENKLEQQVNLRYLLTFLGILILIISLFFFIQAALRNKSNRVLDAQNQQIEIQNEQLEELNDVKNQLFTIISHDLRSPLLSILTSLKMLEQLGSNSPERDWYIQILHQYAIKTKVLLENLLQWAGIQMNNYKPSNESFFLMPMVTELQEEVDFMYQVKAMVFKNEIPPSLQVYSDPGMIRMAIRNLMVNAVKFSNARSVIEIKALKETQEVRIYVKDQGIGMNPEELNKALYGRLTRLGTQAEVGSGIGLSLVRQFLERQKGHLEIKSAPQEGSTFTIVLPQQA